MEPGLLIELVSLGGDQCFLHEHRFTCSNKHAFQMNLAARFDNPVGYMASIW